MPKEKPQFHKLVQDAIERGDITEQEALVMFPPPDPAVEAQRLKERQESQEAITLSQQLKQARLAHEKEVNYKEWRHIRKFIESSRRLTLDEVLEGISSAQNKMLGSNMLPEFLEVVTHLERIKAQLQALEHDETTITVESNLN